MLKSRLNKLSSNKGFSLVELLVVAMILGILALIAIPILNSVLTTVRQKALLADLYNIERVSWLYYFHTGSYPRGAVNDIQTAEVWNDDSRRLFVDFEPNHGSNPGDEGAWGGPYLDKWPDETPIGGIYAYRYYEADNSWATGHVRNFAAHRNDSNSGHIPSNEFIEFIMIRFHYISDDNDEIEKKRDEALEFLLEALGSKRVYYVPNQERNIGWVGIRIFR